MLYISRIVGRNKYGVTDTEDGVEQVVTLNDIKKAVLVHKLDIKGVESYNYTIIDTTYRGVTSVKVYQNPDFARSVQTKAAILIGVDVKLYGDEIVSISVPKPVNKPISIRLSDYGKSCGNYILKDIALSDNLNLTLILDDKISVSSKTFANIADLTGVVFLDLTQVTNKTTVERVYGVGGFAHTVSHLELFVKDVPDRLIFYQAVSFVHRGGMRQDVDYIAYKTDMSELVMKLAERFRKEFDIMSSSNLVLREGCSDVWLNEFITRSSVVKAYKNGTLTYELAQSYSGGLRVIIRDCTTLSLASYDRLRHFISLFDAPEDICQCYMKLCTRLCEFVVNVARDHGLT